MPDESSSLSLSLTTTLIETDSPLTVGVAITLLSFLVSSLTVNDVDVLEGLYLSLPK